MGGGGDAPPLRLHDVAILLGGVMVLASFTLMFWNPGTAVSSSSDFTEVNGKIKYGLVGLNEYELSEGDVISFKVQADDCDSNVTGKCEFSGAVMLVENGVIPDDEDDAEVFERWSELEPGDKEDLTLKATDKGLYQIWVKLDSGNGIYWADADRKMMTQWLPTIIGTLLIGWGFWKNSLEKQ